MLDDINEENILSELKEIQTLPDLDACRVRLFGKNGLITNALKSLGPLSVDEKKEKGATINKIKNLALLKFEEIKQEIESKLLEQRLHNEKVDLTLPSRPSTMGQLHPLEVVMKEVVDYFGKYGFNMEKGPDIEDDFHNFDALNIPQHHPARQDQDTFYLMQPDKLLRTHTSNVQIRTMQKTRPPLRILSVGRVYRVDAPDATHLPMFHQLEGLALEPVDSKERLTLAHLKHLLISFCSAFFGVQTDAIRFRPSHFPFTEPSLELDIHFRKGDKSRWLELLGCGMVHPNVLRNCNIDPEKYQGFAWGMGIERLTMIKYDLTDIRHFLDNDVRWLSRYGSSPFGRA